MPLHEFSRHDSVRHQYVLFYSYHANIRKKRFPSSRILFRQSFPHLESSYHGGYISFAFSISAMISHKGYVFPTKRKMGKYFIGLSPVFSFSSFFSFLFFFPFRLISQISPSHLFPLLRSISSKKKKSKICQERESRERESRQRDTEKR